MVQFGSTNKILKVILTKFVNGSKLDWELKLHLTIWAYWVENKEAIKIIPFNLGYGLDAIIPMEFLIPTMQMVQELNWIGYDCLID